MMTPKLDDACLAKMQSKTAFAKLDQLNIGHRFLSRNWSLPQFADRSRSWGCSGGELLQIKDSETGLRSQNTRTICQYMMAYLGREYIYNQWMDAVENNGSGSGYCLFDLVKIS